MSNAEGIRTFNADASGYVALVEREYYAMSDCDKYVTKEVSPSAFAYFHQVLWWYRVALMAKRRGEATFDQERLVQFVEGYDVVIGAGAAAYLAGMGEYTDVTGVHHYLTASEPGEDGHFGMITERTHRDYETKIAPAVSFQRVISDMALTVDRDAQEFQMPDGIMPDPIVQRQGAAQAQPPAAPQQPAQRGAPRGRGRGRGRGAQPFAAMSSLYF